MSDLELFERAADAGARLLRVERLGLAGENEREAPAFLLTFDVGRILVTADAQARRLSALHIPTPEDVPGGLQVADEDEPWWRLLGAPLHRVERPGASDDAISMQFRADDDNPRRVTIERKGAVATVRIAAN